MLSRVVVEAEKLRELTRATGVHMVLARSHGEEVRLGKKRSTAGLKLNAVVVPPLQLCLL